MVSVNTLLVVASWDKPPRFHSTDHSQYVTHLAAMCRTVKVMDVTGGI